MIHFIYSYGSLTAVASMFILATLATFHLLRLRVIRKRKDWTVGLVMLCAVWLFLAFFLYTEIVDVLASTRYPDCYPVVGESDFRKAARRR